MKRVRIYRHVSNYVTAFPFSKNMQMNDMAKLIRGINCTNSYYFRILLTSIEHSIPTPFDDQNTIRANLSLFLRMRYSFLVHTFV